MRIRQKNAKTRKRNLKNSKSLTIEYHLKYEGDIADLKIKEIEDEKQNIKHKYGRDLVAFAIENCQKGADAALKLAEVLLKLK